MNKATIIEWLLKLRPIGVAFFMASVPALIARWKQHPMTPWYLYGLVCALLAWPAVALPAIHAPTLVLHREDDIVVPVTHGRFIADNIDGARLEILPGN